MFEEVKKLHLKVERFFEERKREATLGRAVGLLVVVALFFGLLETFFVLRDWGMLSFGLDKVFFKALSTLASKSFWSGFTYLFYAAIIFCAGKLLNSRKLLKEKTSFVSVLYCVSVAALVQFVARLALVACVYLLQIKAINELYIWGALLAVTAYFAYVVIKACYKTDHKKTIEVLTTAFIIYTTLSIAVMLAYQAVYTIYASTKPLSDYEDKYELINDSQGSTLQVMMWNGYNCSMKFRQGWKTGKEVEPYFENRKLRIYSSTGILYKGNVFDNFSQRMVFLGVNQVYITRTNEENCDYSWGRSSETVRGLREKGFLLENYATRVYARQEMQTCDAKFVNNETSEIFHSVSGYFLNNIGFQLEYNSRTGSDSELYQILESFECRAK